MFEALRHRSISTLAWSRVSDTSRAGNSSRNFPLKLSTEPFSQGPESPTAWRRFAGLLLLEHDARPYVSRRPQHAEKNRSCDHLDTGPRRSVRRTAFPSRGNRFRW